jgi:hypothetical protein
MSRVPYTKAAKLALAKQEAKIEESKLVLNRAIEKFKFNLASYSSFKVVCDDTNNTPSSIEVGYLYVDIIIAPIQNINIDL